VSARRAAAGPGPAPLLLALDTATDVPSFALGTPADPGDDVRLGDRRALSREIEGVVAALLAAHGAAARDLTAVLVADGPGSFTGLRIGAAFAKGLCRALGVPLVSAPSLLGAAAGAARAAGAVPPVEVAVRYDALRGQWFRAVYRLGTAGVEVLEAPGLAPHGAGPDDATFRGLAATAADASAAALLGLVGRPGGPAVVADPSSWEPAYGRPAEAEARRLAGERATAHP
jgi:tRNA threonylcarbamoyl adenosine modification protein YeaZ